MLDFPCSKLAVTDSPRPHPPEAENENPLAFTPVTFATARHNGWTPARQRDFIQALAVMGVVSRAAKAVGMTKQSAYKLRERADAASFARAWDIALQMGYDVHYDEAIDRAMHGIESPRYYRGKLVGTRRRFDYRLALAVIAQPMPLPQTARNKSTR